MGKRVRAFGTPDVGRIPSVGTEQFRLFDEIFCITVPDECIDPLGQDAAHQVCGAHMQRRALQLAKHFADAAGAHLPHVHGGHERAQLDLRPVPRLDAAVHFPAGDRQVQPGRRPNVRRFGTSLHPALCSGTGIASAIRAWIDYI